MLKITKHKNNHVELHLGTYFRGFVSKAAGFFLLLLSIVILVTTLKGFVDDELTKVVTPVTLCILFGIFRV
jgi:hypothetical protein